jgi:ABC-type transport system substrate-binding protein
VALIACCVAILAVAVGCGATSETSTPSPVETLTPQRGGRLVVAVPLREPNSALRLMLEPLTTFASDGRVVPFLAESVEPNDRFDRWTIRVRPDITFHNGEPLDAKAVKANLDTYSVSPVYGTDPFEPIRATKIVDERTVEVELAAPWASFPSYLTAEQSDGTGLMASPATIEKAGPLFLAAPGMADLYGTGPFVIEASESENDRWIARRNQDYWQEGLPYLNEVELRAVPDSSIRESGLESGDFDLVITSKTSDNPSGFPVFTPDGDVQVLTVALNTQRPPLDDPALREALAAATDVKALAVTAGVDPGSIATGPFGPGSRWSDPAAAPASFDPERARRLVAEHEASAGPVTVRLGAVDLETTNVAVQQQLAQQWSAVGIDVELSVVDPFAQTATLLVAGDFDAALGTQFGKPDPDLYYVWWHSSAIKTEGEGAGYNFVGVNDPALDRALDAARATPDDDTRRAEMVKVQKRLADASPYVWLWGTRWSMVSNSRVQGIGEAPLPGGGTRLAMVGSRPNLEGMWLQP